MDQLGDSGAVGLRRQVLPAGELAQDDRLPDLDLAGLWSLPAQPQAAGEGLQAGGVSLKPRQAGGRRWLFSEV
jgi:hypothetical protein